MTTAAFDAAKRRLLEATTTRRASAPSSGRLASDRSSGATDLNNGVRNADAGHVVVRDHTVEEDLAAFDRLTRIAPEIARMIRDGHYEMSAIQTMGLLDDGMSPDRLIAVLERNMRSISKKCVAAGLTPIASRVIIDPRAGQSGRRKGTRRR